MGSPSSSQAVSGWWTISATSSRLWSVVQRQLRWKAEYFFVCVVVFVWLKNPEDERKEAAGRKEEEEELVCVIICLCPHVSRSNDERSISSRRRRTSQDSRCFQLRLIASPPNSSPPSQTAKKRGKKETRSRWKEWKESHVFEGKESRMKRKTLMKESTCFPITPSVTGNQINSQNNKKTRRMRRYKE